MRSLNFWRFLGSFGTGAWLWVFTFVSAVQALTYIFCCQESALWWTETKEKIHRLSQGLHEQIGQVLLLFLMPVLLLPLFMDLCQKRINQLADLSGIRYQHTADFAARKWFHCQMDKLLSQRTELFSAIEVQKNIWHIMKYIMIIMNIQRLSIPCYLNRWPRRLGGFLWQPRYSAGNRWGWQSSSTVPLRKAGGDAGCKFPSCLVGYLSRYMFGLGPRLL